jgi:hypothetical protein
MTSFWFPSILVFASLPPKSGSTGVGFYLALTEEMASARQNGLPQMEVDINIIHTQILPKFVAHLPPQEYPIETLIIIFRDLGERIASAIVEKYIGAQDRHFLETHYGETAYSIDLNILNLVPQVQSFIAQELPKLKLTDIHFQESDQISAVAKSRIEIETRQINLLPRLLSEKRPDVSWPTEIPWVNKSHRFLSGWIKQEILATKSNSTWIWVLRLSSALYFGIFVMSSRRKNLYAVSKRHEPNDRL